MLKNIRQLIQPLALFLAGIVLGLILFLPREGFWLNILDRAATAAAPHSLAWSGLEDASLTGFTLTGFSFATQQGTVNLSIPRLKVSVGISPMLEVTAITGPALKVEVFRDKSVRFAGGFDLAALGRKELSGTAAAKGSLSFRNWGGPPQSGQLSLEAPALSLPGGLSAEKAKAAADLSDTRLTITSFEAEKPVPVKAQGTVDLVWNNPRASSYALTGSLTLGNKEQSFQKSGTLEQIPGF